MATHSSTLAWKIPWMEEPGRLQFVGSLRVSYNWATSLSRIGGGNGNPFQCSCLENPRDGGAWWAAIYGFAQSWTQLKLPSSSSSRHLFKKIRDTKGTFHAKISTVKDRNGMDLTEAGDIKKRWQEFTELYKKILMTQIITMVWSLT